MEGRETELAPRPAGALRPLGLTAARWLTAAVAAAVAVAFADSSIVVLALPDMLGEFNTSIPGVSWVITSYNVVVAVAAFAIVPFLRLLAPARILAIGLVVFLVASLGAAVSGDLGVLIAFRALQGLGAAALLVGALPVLGFLMGSSKLGMSLWIVTGTIGAAMGPALGGILTQLFDWRAIFVVQAPIAAVALVGAWAARAEEPASDGSDPTVQPRRVWLANTGLGFVFGALVGALFLAVTILVAVWRFEPLTAAVIVTVLPLATVASRPLAACLPRVLGSAGGAGLLALGLVALALLPDSSAGIMAAALALCGVGLGLTVPPLTQESLHDGPILAKTGAWTTGARHAGLVLALVLIAPLLATELDDGAQQAALGATSVILDSEVGISTKVPLALDMRDLIDQTPRGEFPDLAEPFESRGVDANPELAEFRDSLIGTIEAVITRGFRTSFLLCAAFAAATLVPVLLLGARKREANS